MDRAENGVGERDEARDSLQKCMLWLLEILELGGRRTGILSLLAGISSRGWGIQLFTYLFVFDCSSGVSLRSLANEPRNKGNPSPQMVTAGVGSQRSVFKSVVSGPILTLLPHSDPRLHFTR